MSCSRRLLSNLTFPAKQRLLAGQSSGRTAYSQLLKDRPFSRELTADAASVLNRAGIPNLLWGNSLLDVYGVPTIVLDSSFLVSRTQLPAAKTTLSEAGLNICTDSQCGLTFRRMSEIDLQGPNGDMYMNPSVHFHIGNTEDNFSVRLYVKEERLWELEEFSNKGPHFSDGWNQNMILAQDPGLPVGGRWDSGSGRFHDSWPSVRIPTARRLIEGLVLLLVRDRGLEWAKIFWPSMLCYMATFVISRGLLSLDQLDPSVAGYMKGIMTPPLRCRSNFEAAVEALKDRGDKGLTS